MNNNRLSEFDKQAAASLDMIDEQAAAERVQKILHPPDLTAKIVTGDLTGATKIQPAPTLTAAPQTQPQAPAPRKKRSDAGIPKKAPADPDEITVKMSIDLARAIAMACAETNRFEMAAYIQDEVIAQIKKRLDALSRSK